MHDRTVRRIHHCHRTDVLTGHGLERLERGVGGLHAHRWRRHHLADVDFEVHDLGSAEVEKHSLRNDGGETAGLRRASFNADNVTSAREDHRDVENACVWLHRNEWSLSRHFSDGRRLFFPLRIPEHKRTSSPPACRALPVGDPTLVSSDDILGSLPQVQASNDLASRQIEHWACSHPLRAHFLESCSRLHIFAKKKGISLLRDFGHGGRFEIITYRNKLRG
mmetsp:Transcript_48621/g.114814  ORF Transcript_48621/g.114814 Transcript_48621/m.114814 type:complete len:222 (-) Transcript_48621:88-753(-)